MFRRAGMRWAGVLAGAALLLHAARAAARAGGGEHYQGPGGDGGGWGGGDDGAIAELLFLLVRLHFEVPVLAFGIDAAIVLFLVWRYRALPSVATPTQMRRIERSRFDRGQVAAGVQRLRARDPAFEPQAFAGRAARMFLEIQEAWFLRRLEGARRFMSDGLYRRFAVLQDVMRAEGRRDALADVRVADSTVVAVHSTRAFDLVTVAIVAQARDLDVPAALGDEEARARAKGAPPGTFTELWTFVRRLGAKSRAGFDLQEGNCPNCGASFAGGAANKCPYCGAIVNSGRHDWVLSEITQPREWMPPAGESERVLAPLLERDPDAAPEIIHDRALLVFWKWLEARALGRPQILRKLASTSGLAELEETARARMSVRQPAVGGARVVAFEPDVNGFDRVHVDIRWSAGLGWKDAAPPPPTPRRHVLVLVRAADAKTDAGEGLSTERCGNCHAPLTESDSTACDYCGHDFASAGREWQYERLVAFEEWVRPVPAPQAAEGGDRLSARMREIPQFATPGERLRLLRLLASVAHADGDVSASERKLLRACASRWQVPWDEVEQALHGGESPDGAAPAPQNAQRFLSALAEMARVDGKVDRSERRLIEAAARHLRAPPDVVDRVLRT